MSDLRPKGPGESQNATQNVFLDLILSECETIGLFVVYECVVGISEKSKA